ncbi:MAG: hypothetical protein KAS32_04620 [Candidatus Peribacteraceae bacterium]|nr:hypothetical protein [Candidatus Peribacteraceae bacterium]
MSESKKARTKRKSKKKKIIKKRDPLALLASMRQGAGHHGRGRPDKEESRNACRGKIHLEDHLED